MTAAVVKVALVSIAIAGSAPAYADGWVFGLGKIAGAFAGVVACLAKCPQNRMKIIA